MDLSSFGLVSKWRDMDFADPSAALAQPPRSALAPRERPWSSARACRAPPRPRRPFSPVCGFGAAWLRFFFGGGLVERETGVPRVSCGDFAKNVVWILWGSCKGEVGEVSFWPPLGQRRGSGACRAGFVRTQSRSWTRVWAVVVHQGRFWGHDFDYFQGL